MKRRVWSFILCLEFLLAGAWLLRSGILGSEDGIWDALDILLLMAGGILLLIGILAFFWRNKVTASTEKFESVSRYLIQAPLWFLLSLLVVEFTLRAAIYNPPLKMAVTNWAGDIPGVHTFILWGREGYGVTWYDRWGALQTPYHDDKKDNNVIVLGDSQTECLQVFDDLKFVSVAETLLRHDGRDADLHNLGRSGLAMADYVSWIPAYRAIFQPRVIVVQLTTLDFTESFNEGQFNQFVLGEDQSLDLVHAYDLSDGFIQKARRKYRIDYQIEELGYQRWQLMQASFDEAQNNAADENIPVETSGEVQNIEAGENTSTETVNLQTPPAEVPAEGQTVDTSVFNPDLADQQMKLLLEASDGVPLIVVLLPSTPYISGNQVETNDPAHEKLVEFMRRYPQITLVDPQPEFQKLAASGRLPRGFFNGSPGVGHLNKDGNQVVGSLLAQAIGQVFK